MSSSVFFKFKSQKEPQRVTFDGTGISVFELKRDIISISRLGDGTDFDLAIYNPDGNEEYDDDTTIISRGTTVVARRLPAAKPGAGRAARYVSGKMPIMAKNQHRIEASKIVGPAKSGTSSTAGLANNASEEDRIAAMFDQGGEQWEQQQQQMANQKAIHRTGYVKPQAVPDKPLPAGYTCHRCGEKGHWIQACPTNNDPNFDNKPKFRKTTGIPRSFLKVVEKPAGADGEGSLDISQLPAGVMYTANGEWVVAEPDKASWDQYQAKAKASAEKAENRGNDETLKEWGIECPIDSKLFVDPVKTPCCGKTYCRECIENALLSSDFVCPGCSTEGVLVDNLVEDVDALDKIKQYEAHLTEAKVDKAKSVSPGPPESVQATPLKKDASPAADESGTPTKGETDAREVSVSETVRATSVQPMAPGTPGSTTSAGSKKRPAEDELENKRVPTAPAAMRKQQQQKQQEQQQQQQQQFNGQGQSMNDFVQQMNAMAGMGPGQQGMNPFMNPMGFPGMMNPMMMGMPNPMMMMNGMGMPNMMNGAFNQNMGMGMGMGMGNQQQQWQGNNQNWSQGPAGGFNNNNQQGHQNNGDAYMRKPVNPNRYNNRNKNQQQRTADYRELGP